MNFTRRAVFGCSLSMSLVMLAAGPVRGADLQATVTNVPAEVVQYKNLSLQELLEMPIETSGTLIPTSLLKAPSSITIITAKDIVLTPHRNLLDLIRAYVPGAVVLPHSEGRQLGMRGVIADRNLKWLLLVNGRLMNDRAHGGVYTEITNWDLNDIERVEIVRGPGSVTYGPGAIEGVVNIITKSGRDHPGVEVVAKYTSGYDSKLGAISYGLKKPNVDFLAYFSIVATPGVKDPDTFNMEGTLQSGYGFIGTRDFAAGSPKSFPPNPYYNDFEHEPQYKAYLDLKLFEEWRLWGRYTTSGGNMDQRVALTRYPTGLAPGGTNYLFGPPSVSSEIRNQQLTISLENNHKFNDIVSLETSVSPQYQDFERRRRPQLGAVYPASTPPELQQRIGDRNSPWNTQSNFGEYDLLADITVHLAFEKTKVALGYEFDYNRVSAKWGDSAVDLRMGDNQNYVSGPNSRVYTAFFNAVGQNPANYGGVGPTNAVFVGDGWDTYTHSVIGELSQELIPKLTLILSGRIDKNRDSDNLYSPRVATVWEINSKNYLKLNLQQSTRMNTGEQLYASRLQDQTSDSERLRCVELIYDTLPLDGLHIRGSAFLAELDATGFVVSSTVGGASGGVTSLGATTAQGTMQNYGLELDINYTHKDLEVGLNHSFVKLIDFELAKGITSTSISYADYAVPITSGTNVITTLSSTGNDINNWPNNTTKAYLNWKFFKRFTFHVDAQVIWGYEGAQDEIAVMEKAINDPDVPVTTRASVQKALNKLQQEDVWGIDFRTNLSLTYEINKYFTISAFVLNLIGVNGNKTYQHDIGATTLVPRAFYTEEPMVFGVMAKAKF